MTIHYRKADGSHGELINVGELRRLVDAGEVKRDTQIYESLRGTWCRADEHPVSRKWFPPEVGSEPPARTVEAPQPPVTRASAPRPQVQALPSARPPEYWKLGFLPALLLVGLIGVKLAAPHLSAGVSSILDVGGLCFALVTLLGVALAGIASAFSRGSSNLALAGASAIPLVAFGAFAYLLIQKPSTPRQQAGSAPVAAPTPTKPKPPAMPELITPTNAQKPAAPTSGADIDQALAKFKMKVEREQSNLLTRLGKENLSTSFAVLNVHDQGSIKTCRTKLGNVARYMDDFIRNVEGAYDALALEVEAPLSGKAREEADLEFKIAKEMTLSDLKDFFKAIKAHNDDADRMLSFMEGLAEVGKPSSADILTLQLYNSRLRETASRLDEMASELDGRMIRAQAGLHERLSRSTWRTN